MKLISSAENTSAIAQNTDPKEIERFNQHAEEWWNPQGRFRPVHAFNDVRLKQIEKWIIDNFERDLTSSRPFNGLSCVDIGCGGGLISEPLAARGARVTGIDASIRNIAIAEWHAHQSEVDVKYRAGVVEDIIAEQQSFDVVLNLEVLEHVPDPNRLISACGKLLKPNGILIFATLNRTIRSFILAILGAEYVLRWLPKGTHQWSRFIQPSEIENMLLQDELTSKDLCGVSYNPLKNKWSITSDSSVNYMMLVQRSIAHATSRS